MRQEQFVTTHQALWQTIEDWLTYQQLSRKERERRELSEPELNFPQAYRQLCHHLALAQSRLYSPLLIERLNQLVVQGHHHLYASRLHFWHVIVNYFLHTFPSQVRHEWKALVLSTLLFFGSLISMIVAVQLNPELAYSVLSGEQIAMMEDMYDPELRSRFGREREADSDVLMFGHYIRNNTGIGFQVFAGGLVYGIGSIFFLLFNGLVIGAIAGHLTEIGYVETFWGFVAGHSAFELTAIVLSGVAGFKLAEALLFPGRKSRRLALLDNSKTAVSIMYGTATLFLMAAFVEAFWSSIAWLPIMVKYSVGIALWLLVIAYFLFVGRKRTKHTTGLVT